MATKKTIVNVNVNSMSMEELHALQKEIQLRIEQDAIEQQEIVNSKIKQSKDRVHNLQDRINILIGEAVHVISHAPHGADIELKIFNTDFVYNREIGWYEV